MALTNTISLGATDDGSVYQTVSLPLSVDVYETTKQSPVIGELSEVEQTGFVWDKALLVSADQARTKYNTYTGGLDHSLTKGTLIGDWESGAVEGLEVLSLNRKFCPEIEVGSFTVSSGGRTLYSDYSYTAAISPLNDVDGKNTHTLPGDYRLERVYALRRDDNLINLVVDEFTLVGEFSDSYANEYMIEDGVITLNGNYVRPHGTIHTLENLENIKSGTVYLGNGTALPKDFFVTHFPIVPETVRAYVIYSDYSIERWSFVDNFDWSVSTDAHLVLNSDLGVVSCGGYKPSDLVLSSELNDSDDELYFYVTKDIATYPMRGIVTIGSETIAYTHRAHNRLTGCTRGYLGSTVSSHVVGDKVEYVQRGASIPENGSLYFYFESTVRVDCEVTEHRIRTGEVDCRPSKHSSASQIVQISSKLRDLDRLVLETEKPSLGANIYGPVYFGNDTAKCIVTAYDSMDNPVDSLEVVLEILEPIKGLLDGELAESVKLTNSVGKAFYYYNAPVDWSEYAYKFDEVTYSGSSTVFAFDKLPPVVNLDDIYIFQILKHDPSYGSVGTRYKVISINNASTFPGAVSKVELEGVPGEEYVNGLAYFLSGSSVSTRSVVGVSGSNMYLSEIVDTGVTQVWLLERDALTWDATLLNGVPVILYSWSIAALHPVKGTVGAYLPIVPSSTSSTAITYSQTFPQPAPEDISSNLGGYLIMTPSKVSLRAKAVDPYSGELVYSNTIHLVLNLPNYLVGVDRSGALPIPKGFNLITSVENVGNGLGGANFLTINRGNSLFGLQLKFQS